MSETTKEGTPRGRAGRTAAPWAAAALAAALLTAWGPTPSWSRPYYAAKKGLSCAACHVAPAGGGARRTRENSPGRLSDAVSLGADLRTTLKRAEGKASVNPAGFELFEGAAYLTASPGGGLTLVYENNKGSTAQAYGIWKAGEGSLPYYVRAGRFFVPYGLQTDELDQSSYIKTTFAPQVGFSMFSSQSDTGLEVGLAPKKGFFIDLSLTNGSVSGAQNDAKAVTARAGVVRGWENAAAGVGITGYRNDPLGLSNKKEERTGVFGWGRYGPVTLLGEAGKGRDTPNNWTNPTVDKAAFHAEADVDVVKDYLLFKAKVDWVDPDRNAVDDTKRRTAVGLEWFPIEGAAVEVQYRFNSEPAKVNNDEAVAAAHVWF